MPTGRPGQSWDYACTEPATDEGDRRAKPLTLPLATLIAWMIGTRVILERWN